MLFFSCLFVSVTQMSTCCRARLRTSASKLKQVKVKEFCVSVVHTLIHISHFKRKISSKCERKAITNINGVLFMPQRKKSKQAMHFHSSVYLFTAWGSSSHFRHRILLIFKVVMCRSRF